MFGKSLNKDKLLKELPLILKNKLPPNTEGRVVIELYPEDESANKEFLEKIAAKVGNADQLLAQLHQVIGVKDLSASAKLKGNLLSKLVCWKRVLVNPNCIWQTANYQNEAMRQLLSQFAEVDTALDSQLKEFHKESVFTPDEIQQVGSSDKHDV